MTLAAGRYRLSQPALSERARKGLGACDGGRVGETFIKPRGAQLQILFGRDRQLEAFDEIACRLYRPPTNHVTFHRPIEDLTPATDDSLRNLGIDRFGIEQHAV